MLQLLRVMNMILMEKYKNLIKKKLCHLMEIKHIMTRIII